VSQETYDNTFIGTRVTVGYLPDDPTQATLAGRWRDDTERNTMLILGLSVGGVAIAIALGLAYTDLKNRRLSAHGHFIPAQLEEARTMRTRNGLDLHIKYSFLTPEGERLTKKASNIRNDLKNMPLPVPGTRMVVLYVDRRNFRLM
jgi:hypothetical protein